ncbi:MAG: hypothetical protein NTW65_10280 [Deltaproteobacteria bacterium]|nr:hypothetical protein [Deltaproteobacteria bacterium]
MSYRTELLSNLPDSIFEGSDEIFAEEYINAEKDVREKMDEILTKMTSMCVKVLGVVFAKCKESNVLKSAIDLVSKKGDLAREWCIKILEEQNQPVPMLNIALLVIINVGHSKDIGAVRRYTKYPNPSIRNKALDVAAKLNKKDAEVLIIEALNDEDEKVWSNAANIIDRESSLSEESINKICLFVKTKLLQNKDITIQEAKRFAGLIRATGKLNNYINKEPLEDEIISITSDLLKGKGGLLKFIKADPNKEQLEIIYACLSALGKIGGNKSRKYLNTLPRVNSTLSKIAHETIEELDKKTV